MTNRTLTRSRFGLAAIIPATVFFFLLPTIASSQTLSVARQWNEVLLEAIRNDFARPTVHARNLFHISAAMYDAWAAYDPTASTFLLGKQKEGFVCPFTGFPAPSPSQVEAARATAVSYAAYRIILHRFASSPGGPTTFGNAIRLLRTLGYDPDFTSTDYSTGSAAALGNYIAASYINFGLQDGSNEQNRYANRFYKPVNPGIYPWTPGNPTMVDPNRWQPLQLDVFIDQSGQVIGGGPIPFLSPEWGHVVPFSLQKDDLTLYSRSGDLYPVYHDPGPPPHLGLVNPEAYQWNFALVAAWSAHLDPADSVMWDTSPAGIGNVTSFPSTLAEYKAFYDYEGGDPGAGHAINPKTGQPYAPQIVPRGDYTRVLAEFWADGPDSETPPGHWFKILNYVTDHPDFERRFEGTGPVLPALEWDVKSYFALGGAVHDAAIAAWGVKGWYDYVRPISAIRYMAGQGQGSDPNSPRYSPLGIPLLPGFIEQVQAGEPLAGSFNENAGQVKLRTWNGPSAIGNPQTQMAGVGWNLAANWWPYQRPTFVTPPFGGYVSGHSTFSRASAEVMTALTGDPYFPGGMGIFDAEQNEFLVFEDGPSRTIELQWATYRDASDQCSLSRIWGGIHPPCDDIPGRKMGLVIGQQAFAYARRYFKGEFPNPDISELPMLFPNPVERDQLLSVLVNPATGPFGIQVFDLQGKLVLQQVIAEAGEAGFTQLPVERLTPGMYLVVATGRDWKRTEKVVVR